MLNKLLRSLMIILSRERERERDCSLDSFNVYGFLQPIVGRSYHNKCDFRYR